jgi:hypothetical protein
MPGAKRTRRTTAQPGSAPNTPPIGLDECHELAVRRALELAGGDRRRLEPIDTRTIRVVNPGKG